MNDERMRKCHIGYKTKHLRNLVKRIVSNSRSLRLIDTPKETSVILKEKDSLYSITLLTAQFKSRHRRYMYMIECMMDLYIHEMDTRFNPIKSLLSRCLPFDFYSIEELEMKLMVFDGNTLDK